MRAFLKNRTTQVCFAALAAFVSGVIVGRLLAGHVSLAVWTAAVGIWADVVAMVATTPSWVGALGTWAGAIATVAAIVWAVHTFQQETRARDAELRRALTEKSTRERNLAEAVTLECVGGQFLGPAEAMEIFTIRIAARNGASEPATILGVSAPEVTFPSLSVDLGLPRVLAANGGEAKAEVAIEPPIKTTRTEYKRRPFGLITLTVRYAVEGVEWERTGSGAPQRSAS